MQEKKKFRDSFYFTVGDKTYTPIYPINFTHPIMWKLLHEWIWNHSEVITTNGMHPQHLKELNQIIEEGQNEEKKDLL